MSAANRPDLGILFLTLRDVARQKGLVTCGELSHRYREKTGLWFEPQGAWDDPLGELNAVLDRHGMPALSAVVVLKGQQEIMPGEGFWSCPSVGPRPTDPEGRFSRWYEVLNKVYTAAWPEEFPEADTDPESLSFREIETMYASEWVLLDGIEVDEGRQVYRARVLFHSKERDEVYRKALELRPGNAGLVLLEKSLGETAVNL